MVYKAMEWGRLGMVTIRNSHRKLGLLIAKPSRSFPSHTLMLSHSFSHSLSSFRSSKAIVSLCGKYDCYLALAPLLNAPP